MQIPGIASSQPEPAVPDSGAGLGQVEHAVERVTQVRSLDDVWRLAGEFREELLRFAFQLVIALAVMAAFLVVYLVVSAGLRQVFDRARLEEDVRHLLESVAKYAILGQPTVIFIDAQGRELPAATRVTAVIDADEMLRRMRAVDNTCAGGAVACLARW